MKTDKKENIFFGVIIAVTIALIIAFLAGCTTEKKVKKYVIDNPEVLSDICPGIDTVFKTKTVIKVDTFTQVVEDTAGQSDIVQFIQMLDSIRFQQTKDSLIKLCGKKQIIYKTITKNVFRTDTLILSDKVALDEAETNGYNKGLIEGKKSNKPFLIAAIIGFGLFAILLLFVIIFYRLSKSIKKASV